MGLKLYDTMRRAKVDFAPINPSNVRVYACGPTVYDRIHIGNGRMAVVFDVLFRTLRHLYGAEHVTYVRNITDVDDKINLRAFERGQTIRALTENTAAEFHADVDGLGCLRPTVEPRATDHVEEIKAIIDRLVAGGFAYVADEHVVFHVPAMPAYGALSRRTLGEMEAGARVEVEAYKRDPADFVLWKPSREPHEPRWPSPAGIAAPGRPGWHIECSAMAWKHLGETFDIHGGGIDLVFPHHENEIAQSCCAFGRPVMANVWMHNGFVNVEAEKMSKSLGNVTTVEALLADWPGEVLRLTLLKTHYRQPMDWTLRSLEDSRRVLDGWHRAAGEVEAGAPDDGFVALLADDLNTAGAVGRLHELSHAGEAAALKGSAGLLGLLDKGLSAWRQAAQAAIGVDAGMVERRIAERLDARRRRDFAASDRIRDELAALGVRLKDGKDASTGEPTTTWEAAP